MANKSLLKVMTSLEIKQYCQAKLSEKKAYTNKIEQTQITVYNIKDGCVALLTRENNIEHFFSNGCRDAIAIATEKLKTLKLIKK